MQLVIQVKNFLSRGIFQLSKPGFYARGKAGWDSKCLFAKNQSFI